MAKKTVLIFLLFFVLPLASCWGLNVKATHDKFTGDNQYYAELGGSEINDVSDAQWSMFLFQGKPACELELNINDRATAWRHIEPAADGGVTLILLLDEKEKIVIPGTSVQFADQGYINATSRNNESIRFEVKNSSIFDKVVKAGKVDIRLVGDTTYDGVWQSSLLSNLAEFYNTYGKTGTGGGNDAEEGNKAAPPDNTAAQAESGQTGGIGLELGTPDGRLTVISVRKGGPAEKAGMKAGDVITAIGGESTVGMTQDNSSARLHGVPGTNVTISVLRKGEENVKRQFKLTRVDLQKLTGGKAQAQATSAAPMAALAGKLEQKFKELKDLRDKKLITEEEYTAAKKELLENAVK